MAYDDGDPRLRDWLRIVFPELLADLPDDARIEIMAARVCERLDALETASEPARIQEEFRRLEAIIVQQREQIKALAGSPPSSLIPQEQV